MIALNRLLAATTFAALLSSTFAAASPPDLHVDVTPSSAPQELQMVERDFGANEGTGWHIHHGVELAYVLRGDVELRIARRPALMLHAGDSFEVPRDTPHEATNIGSGEASLIVTYLIDKGGPVKIPVPAPAQ